MARKRMIDPEFWSDEEIGSWSFAARLFYIGLWNFADDDGRFKANDKLLRAQIFPYDSDIDIPKLKRELNHKIDWYQDEGAQYGHIVNFSKYQRIDRPTPSRLPDPNKCSRSTPEQIQSTSGVLSESSASPQRELEANISKVKLSKDNINPALSAPATADIVNKAVDNYEKNQKVATALAAVNKDGFNIYAALERVRVARKQPKGAKMPDEILLQLCEQYWKYKPQIRDHWPWFIRVLGSLADQYNANRNVMEHQEMKKMQLPENIRDILKGIGDGQVGKGRE